jgi:Na+/melibiose symporter-like transporter
LTKRVEKHHLLAATTAVQALAYGALVFAPAANFALTLTAVVAVGIAMGAWLILPTSMLADIIDHGELATSERRSGSYVAVYNLAMKIGLALGVGLSFGLLDIVGYDPSATEYSPADARNIRLLGYGLPALLFAATTGLLLKYPITKHVQQQLRRKIETRSDDAAHALIRH